jgi:chemotaxis signal transduction protein
MSGTAAETFVPPPSCWRTIGVYGEGRPTCPLLEGCHHCRNCDVFRAAGRALFERPPADGYLEDWSRQIAQPLPSPPGPHEDVLVLVLGERRVALPVASVREVVPVRALRRLPPPHDAAMAGLVNVRGELLPAVVLEAVLGWPLRDPLEARRLVVFGRTSDDAVALLVSEVAAVRRIETVAESPHDLPDQVVERPLVRQVLHLDGEEVPLVDAIVLDQVLGSRA